MLLRTGKADEAAQLVTTVRQRAFRNHPEKAKVTGNDLKQPSKYVYGTVSDYVLTPQERDYPGEFGRFYDELGWEFVGETMRRRDMIHLVIFLRKPDGFLYKTKRGFPESVPDPTRSG